MRVTASRNWMVIGLMGCLLFAYIFVRNRLESAESDSVVRMPQQAAISSSSNVAASTKNLGDEVQRITEIVNALPQLGAKGALKYGFEWLTPERAVTPVLPSMAPGDAETIFYKFIQSLQIKCPQKTRIGRNEDGGWDACISGPLNISQPCLVYSIGMGGEWSFDHMITDKYKCLDMAYDPSLGKGDHKPKDLLWFFNTGLGISNTVNAQKWKLRTFGSLLEANGHLNSTIDILKIDIEYSEWESLEAIFSEQSLRNVKQLMVEFHTMEVHEGKSSSTSNYAYYWQVLRGIDRLGFKQWHYLQTPTGGYTSIHTKNKLPCCANVYFVNTAYLV